MKVTSENSSSLNPSPKIDKESTRSDLDSLVGDDAEFEGLSEKTSFASVLDRVTQSRKEPAVAHTEKRDGSLTPHESKAKQKDEPEDTAAIAVADRSLISEPLMKTEMNTDVRSILPTGDLESIVAACRVQVTAGGSQEVTVDLSHSVLDGLRVKVSADSAGRITTEFLAANDGIKSLLDSRSSELMALLRARGVNLANFKSSVSADANAGDGSRSGQDRESNVVRQNGAVSSINESTSDSAAADELAIGATYRA